MMLKAIHAHESKASAHIKAVQVVEKFREMKLSSATKKLGLVFARIRHLVSIQWGTKSYMNMEHLYELDV